MIGRRVQLSALFRKGLRHLCVTFGDKQHSIVQRLLKALRRKAAQKVIAETAAEGGGAKMPPRGLWAPGGSVSPPPPPPHPPRHSNRTFSDRPRLPPVTSPREAIRGVNFARRLTAQRR